MHRSTAAMRLLSLSLLLLLAAAARSPPPSSDWRAGDIFVGSHGRVLVVDGRTLSEKAPLMLFTSGGHQACRSWVTGAAFNKDGTLLYLVCHGSSMVLVADAASAAHPIVAAFPTAPFPSSIVVDRSGNLFVGSADPRGRVHKHHPNGTVLSTIQLDSASSPHGSPWLALNNAQTRVLSTRHGQQLQQYDLTSRAILPALQADKTAGGQCFGLQALDDGSVLVACKACVHQVWQAAPTTIRFCASNATSEAHASNATAVAKELKMLALDPTGAAFYVADAAQALVFKVATQGAATPPLARIALNGTRKIHSLTVMRRADPLLAAALQPIVSWGAPVPLRARQRGNGTTGGRRKRGP